MAYKRVTEEERRLIYRWRQDGHGLREIARRLGRAASSISREITRNTGGRGYRPKQAHRKGLERGLRPGPRRFTEDVRTETGLYAYTFRYYSPEMGRWLSRDPMGEVGGINLYGFCGNQATTLIDHLGLTGPCCHACPESDSAYRCNSRCRK